MNRFLVDFKYYGGKNYEEHWYKDTARLQSEMKGWLIENIDCVEAFPHWQFKTGTLCYLLRRNLTEDDEYLEIHDGVYIFDDAARVAFKLRFGV